jgi:hypothetical protein
LSSERGKVRKERHALDIDSPARKATSDLVVYTFIGGPRAAAGVDAPPEAGTSCFPGPALRGIA